MGDCWSIGDAMPAADRFRRDRIERSAQAAGILGLALGMEPAQHHAAAFADEVDEAEILTGITEFDVGEMPVAV